MIALLLVIATLLALSLLSLVAICLLLLREPYDGPLPGDVPLGHPEARDPAAPRTHPWPFR